MIRDLLQADNKDIKEAGSTVDSRSDVSEDTKINGSSEIIRSASTEPTSSINAKNLPSSSKSLPESAKSRSSIPDPVVYEPPERKKSAKSEGQYTLNEKDTVDQAKDGAALKNTADEEIKKSSPQPDQKNIEKVQDGDKLGEDLKPSSPTVQSKVESPAKNKEQTSDDSKNASSPTPSRGSSSSVDVGVKREDLKPSSPTVQSKVESPAKNKEQILEDSKNASSPTPSRGSSSSADVGVKCEKSSTPQQQDVAMKSVDSSPSPEKISTPVKRNESASSTEAERAKHIPHDSPVQKNQTDDSKNDERDSKRAKDSDAISVASSAGAIAESKSPDVSDTGKQGTGSKERDDSKPVQVANQTSENEAKAEDSCSDAHTINSLVDKSKEGTDDEKVPSSKSGTTEIEISIPMPSISEIPVGDKEKGVSAKSEEKVEKDIKIESIKCEADKSEIQPAVSSQQSTPEPTKKNEQDDVDKTKDKMPVPEVLESKVESKEQLKDASDNLDPKKEDEADSNKNDGSTEPKVSDAQSERPVEKAENEVNSEEATEENGKDEHQEKEPTESSAVEDSQPEQPEKDSQPSSPVSSPMKQIKRPLSPKKLTKGASPRKKNGMLSPIKTPKTPDSKKLPPIKAPVGFAPNPNLKNIKSKIGSFDNIKYKPGGGDKKVISMKLEWKAAPKICSIDRSEKKKDKDKSQSGDESKEEKPEETSEVEQDLKESGGGPELQTSA